MIYRLFYICFLTGMAHLALPQQSTIVGHFHDLPAYYNPALAKGGQYSEVGLLHRSQWTQLGYPVTNLAYFKYNPQWQLKVMKPEALGTFIQYDNFSLINRTRLQLYGSHTAWENSIFRLGIGWNLEGQLTQLNRDEFNLAELVDPELAPVNSSFEMQGSLGACLETNRFSMGVAGGLNGSNGFRDLLATLSQNFALPQSHITIRPAAIYRLSPNLKSQFEFQTRFIYKRNVAVTGGYRQDFGAIIQLSILVDQAKISYGSELPTGNKSSLGLSHEVLLNYRFTLNGKKQMALDSARKANLRALTAARLDSLRALRMSSMTRPTEEKNEDELTLVQSEPDSSLVAISTPETQPPAPPAPDQIISFDELPRKLEKSLTHVVLKHIGFEVGYDILKPYAYHELDKLGHYLRNSPELTIEIQGHTDNQGAETTNQELSYRRALTVFNYLVSRGIKPSRMTVKGYGASRPIADNSTEEGRELNRRIEVLFINTSSTE